MKNVIERTNTKLDKAEEGINDSEDNIEELFQKTVFETKGIKNT